MTMRPQTQSTKVIETLRALGIARLRELMDAGAGQETVARLVRDGRIIRLARGLYQLPDANLEAAHTKAEACKLVPKGVVCLISALQFHELTVQLPRSIWMAIETRARKPKISYPPIEFVRFSETALKEGVEKHIIEGVTTRVTSPAYTVADCFRYRNKIGIDVALEGMREGLKRKACTADAIMKAAQKRRIWTKLSPYLEAMVEYGG